MGYRRGKKTYNISFEEHPGLVVKAHGVSMGKLMDLAGLSELAGGSFKPQDLEKIDDLLGVFAGAVTSWNLEDEDGSAVPVSLAILKEQDTDFVLELLMAGLDAGINISGPLEKKSSGGVQSPEVLLPMDVL